MHDVHWRKTLGVRQNLPLITSIKWHREESTQVLAQIALGRPEYIDSLNMFQNYFFSRSFSYRDFLICFNNHANVLYKAFFKKKITISE